MFSKHIRHTSTIIGIAFIIIALFTCVGYARERTDLPEHYPEEFDGWGRIDRISDEEIVIDDSLFRFSPYVIFNTPARMNVPRDRFRKGQSVYYILNEENKIVSIWLIE